MTWWDFGLLCGLALQALLLWRLVRVLGELRRGDRDFLRSELARIAHAHEHLWKQIEATQMQVSQARESIKMLGAIDIGVYRDSGWLILISKVNGQDWVKLQELAPMDMSKYRALCARLEELGAEFKYIDGPRMARDFLKAKRGE